MTPPRAVLTMAAVTGIWLALLPAPSPAATAAGASAPRTPQPAGLDEQASDPAPSPGAGGVRQTEVCFTVHNGGDPTPQQVSGTLFHTSSYSEASTAVLLYHGVEAERSFWDGGWPRIKGAPSTARALARAGYGVFAVDRLGYGRSEYSGSGYALTYHNELETTHEIITQIRTGTYRTATDGCVDAGELAPHGAANVVLGGLSGGALAVELYATRYHDIAALVPFAWSNQGFSAAFTDEVIVGHALPQTLHDDYIQMFPRGKEACARWLFHLDGVRRPVVDQFCGPEYFDSSDRPRTPAGHFLGGAPAIQDVKANVGLVGPTPVLLVFADHDALFPTGQHGPEDVVSGEIAMWRTRCNCDLSVYMQQAGGHVATYHDTAPAMLDAVIDWLRTRGL